MVFTGFRALVIVFAPRGAAATPGRQDTPGAAPGRPCGDLNAREMWSAACLALHGLALDKEAPSYLSGLAVGRGEDSFGLTESLRIRDPRDGKVL